MGGHARHCAQLGTRGPGCVPRSGRGRGGQGARVLPDGRSGRGQRARGARAYPLGAAGLVGRHRRARAHRLALPRRHAQVWQRVRPGHGGCSAGGARPGARARARGHVVARGAVALGRAASGARRVAVAGRRQAARHPPRDRAARQWGRGRGRGWSRGRRGELARRGRGAFARRGGARAGLARTGLRQPAGGRRGRPVRGAWPASCQTRVGDRRRRGAQPLEVVFTNTRRVMCQFLRKVSARRAPPTEGLR